MSFATNLRRGLAAGEQGLPGAGIIQRKLRLLEGLHIGQRGKPLVAGHGDAPQLTAGDEGEASRVNAVDDDRASPDTTAREAAEPPL